MFFVLSLSTHLSSFFNHYFSHLIAIGCDVEHKIQPHNFWCVQLVLAGRWHLSGLKILDLKESDQSQRKSKNSRLMEKGGREWRRGIKRDCLQGWSLKWWLWGARRGEESNRGLAVVLIGSKGSCPLCASWQRLFLFFSQFRDSACCQQSLWFRSGMSHRRWCERNSWKHTPAAWIMKPDHTLSLLHVAVFHFYERLLSRSFLCLVHTSISEGSYCVRMVTLARCHCTSAVSWFHSIFIDKKWYPCATGGFKTLIHFLFSMYVKIFSMLFMYVYVMYTCCQTELGVWY